MLLYVKYYMKLIFFKYYLILHNIIIEFIFVLIWIYRLPVDDYLMIMAVKTNSCTHNLYL